MSEQRKPEMMEPVTLEGFVNGYSEAREGDGANPIVSVFIPDGSQTFGFHGASGTTIWMSLERYNELRERP